MATTPITARCARWSIRCQDRATPFVLRGSGGMAKAVATALVDAGFHTGTIVARNEAKGRALADGLGLGWSAQAEAAPILVNVTPLGMVGPDADSLAFEPALIEAADLVIDVVARPAETPLIRAAQARSKQVISGAQIAMLQSLEQFVLYTGVTPSPEQIA